MTAKVNPKDSNVINLRTYNMRLFFVQIFYCVNTFANVVYKKQKLDKLSRFILFNAK